MDAIRAHYEKWLRNITAEDTLDTAYQKAEERARLIEYTAQGLTLFSKGLKEFETEEFFSYTGLYLSAMSNNAREDEINLQVQDIGRKLNSVGYRNRKVLVIEGDIGNLGGYEMVGGRMIVAGNAASSLGKHLHGGEIMIRGNAGYWVGEGMMGGKITIVGHVGDLLGLEMENGEITVHGDAGNYVGRSMKGGTITIVGNVEHWLGQYMSGGELVVKGNAKNAVGNLMEGGRIILLGDAGELLGWEMQAGEIWIKGSIRRS